MEDNDDHEEKLSRIYQFMLITWPSHGQMYVIVLLNMCNCQKKVWFMISLSIKHETAQKIFFWVLFKYENTLCIACSHYCMCNLKLLFKIIFFLNKRSLLFSFQSLNFIQHVDFLHAICLFSCLCSYIPNRGNVHTVSFEDWQPHLGQASVLKCYVHTAIYNTVSNVQR